MKNIEQLDIFGGSTPLEDLSQPSKPNGRKYKTMQQLYGTIAGKTCKSCKHHVCYNYHDKNYHKCELWHVSNSAATDIRLKHLACGKYEETKK